MKLTQIEREIRDVFRDDQFSCNVEFVTTTGARVDLAIHSDEKPVLAVEFEESYKWMRARSLYDAVKADTEGFSNLAIIYPFEQRGLENCWIFDYIESDLDIDAEIVKPTDIVALRDIFGL